MRPGLERDPAARHSVEHLPQGLRRGAHFPFPLQLAPFIQNAVPTGAIAEVQSDRQLWLGKIAALLAATVLIFFIAGLLYLLCLQARR